MFESSDTSQIATFPYGSMYLDKSPILYPYEERHALSRLSRYTMASAAMVNLPILTRLGGTSRHGRAPPAMLLGKSRGFYLTTRAFDWLLAGSIKNSLSYLFCKRTSHGIYLRSFCLEVGRLIIASAIMHTGSNLMRANGQRQWCSKRSTHT